MALVAAAAFLIPSCQPPAENQPREEAVHATSAGSNEDGALDLGSFVFVEEPRSGARVSTGFAVTGFSRTFESTVNWSLKARDGSELASGHAMGGGVDGLGRFSFEVAFSTGERQVGHLEVFETDASDGEGFPPPRNVIPLVLNP